MRALRVFILVLYASYLTNVGLLLIMLPWSEVWIRFVLLTPPRLGIVLDSPISRGVISAFGVLHFVLLAFEIVIAEATLRRGSS